MVKVFSGKHGGRLIQDCFPMAFSCSQGWKGGCDPRWHLSRCLGIIPTIPSTPGVTRDFRLLLPKSASRRDAAAPWGFFHGFCQPQVEGKTQKFLFVGNVPSLQTIFPACTHQTTAGIKEFSQFVVVSQSWDFFPPKFIKSLKPVRQELLSEGIV